MSKKSILLSNIQKDEDFIEKMDSVFRDLRADFDVSSLIHSKEKIQELLKVNVDTTGDTSTLSTLSVASNGVITGLRGTGKSHLLLLARDKINSNKSSFCVYVNFKEHFNIGGESIVDERFYVWVILSQLKIQLCSIANIDQQSTKGGLIQAIVNFFDKGSKEKKNIEVELIDIFNEIDILISHGEKEFRNFNIVKSLDVDSQHTDNFNTSVTLGAGKIDVTATTGNVYTESTKEGLEYTSNIFLDINTLKSLLVRIVETIKLKSIVFYYDEWSTRSRTEQNKLSELIQALSTSPLYHWIAYIPYKSSLGVLELTADMPHTIDLDLKYIYEENNNVCTEYFNKFANNRFSNVFGENIIQIQDILSVTYIDMLIKASMGNTRDFGILLYKAWSEYKADHMAKKKCRIINKRHIVNAIKSLSREKLNNLHSQESNYAEKLWNEIIKFVGEKKHTHFCIELNKDNQTYIKQDEIQALLYHRLIHLRKNDIPPKDGGEYRLSMYAVDLSTLHSRIYETKSATKQIKAVTDINIIHNQIRRYIFQLGGILNEFRVEQGRQMNCLNCKKTITSEMKFAWELG